MNDFWAKWQTVANNTGTTAAGQGAANALIAQGQLVAATVSTGSTAVTGAWADARSAAAATVTTINDAATRIADLNTAIRSLTAAGSNVEQPDRPARLGRHQPGEARRARPPAATRTARST